MTLFKNTITAGNPTRWFHHLPAWIRANCMNELMFMIEPELWRKGMISHVRRMD